MSGLTLEHLITAIMEAQVTIDPWLALVGLVDLNTSQYCQRGEAYAVDPRSSFFPEGRQFALIHPDDAAEFRKTMRDVCRMNHDPTDAELAAWVYETAHRLRRPKASKPISYLLPPEAWS